MHIARVVHIFYPEGLVGDPFGSFEMSHRQVAAGHRVSVITWARRGPPRIERPTEGLRVYRLKGINFRLNGKITEYPFLPGLPRLLEKIRPDIVHAESHLFLTTFLAVSEARKLKLPSVVSVHGVIAQRDVLTNLLQHSYMRTVGAWILQNCTMVRCLTKNDAQEIAEYGADSARTRIVPNAVDLEIFRPLRKDRGYPLFIWAGRFTQEKGLHYLISAIQIVRRVYRDAKFILIGDGPVFSSIRRMVLYLGLGDCVTFPGPVDRQSIARLLPGATAFVFPSLREGMPNAVLEAMACGLPVVAFDIPGIGEIVQNGREGLLVRPRSSRDLAEAIVSLIRFPDMAKMFGGNARKRVEERHCWKKTLAALDAVYEEALGRGS
jgi:glycosyltransferase involved in cell wall biosynthesis